MKQLAEYLNARKAARIETKKAFAARLGVNEKYLSQLLSGFRSPSLPLAFKIERATDGAVPVSAWAPE